MPPLFIYAVAFLSVLMVVGFVLCLREGAGEKGTPRPAGAGIGGSAGRAAPQAPLGQQAAEAPQPLHRRPAPARAGAAVAQAPQSASSFYQGSTDGSFQRAGSSRHVRLGFPAPRSGDASDSYSRSAYEPHPAGAMEAAGSPDPLSRQVAQLARQVEELKAERQIFEDEIRRLHRVVREATATIEDLNGARGARPARAEAGNVRHISIGDLRVRRVS